jgi:RNA polymerase sigma-70 factor (ECF subfamily)
VVADIDGVMTPEQRFTRIFDAHHDAVRAYAWRRDQAVADDVVAETFLVAWRKLDRVPDDELPWLLAVARNVRLNMARASRRRRHHEARLAPPGPQPSFVGAVHERLALSSALASLSEVDREILLLAAWEDLDRPAIARVVGCSTAAVAVRLFRARRRLERALQALDRPFPTEELRDAS